MLKDFDIAFTNKIKAYYSNTVYANTAIVYNVAYNLVDDPTVKLEFPMISIYRPTGFNVAPMQNFAAKRRGIEFYQDGTALTRSMARFIMVQLAYQLDIYAKSPEELDDMTEELMHALSLDPSLQVSQYDAVIAQNFTETYSLVYNNGPVEQSEFQNGDRVYHYSVVYQIDTARLLNFKDDGVVVTPEITEVVIGTEE
jgi:hypothetical protein